MIQLLLAFLIAVFWAGVFALAAIFIPLIPNAIGVVFVGAFLFSWLGLALANVSGRRVRYE